MNDGMNDFSHESAITARNRGFINVVAD